LLPTFDSLRTGETPPLIAGARRAEELGFDGGWVGDHLSCLVPVLESTVALSMAAAVTQRISLGFSVMLLALRPSEMAAHQIASVDALSGGRLVLGVGVGGECPQEFTASGVPIEERGRQLDAALSDLPAQLAGARMPRVLVGGRGEAALRRTAQFGDGWLPMWLSPDVIAERATRLRELAAQADRPPPSLGLLILTRVDDDPQRARHISEEHLRTQYNLPLKVVEPWLALGDEDRVAATLRPYLTLGLSDIILMPLGDDPLAQYERLAAVRGMLD